MPAAVITGTTRGIGLALVHQFARHGFDVFLVARTGGDLQRQAASLSRKYPGQSFPFFAVDLAQKKDLEELARAVSGQFTALHAVVFNAGLFSPGNLMEIGKGPSLDEYMQLHLLSNHFLCQQWKPLLASGAHIFSVCSVVSREPRADSAAYSLSKMAQFWWTRMLRHEWQGEAIRITAVLPGQTLTGSWEGIPVDPDRILSPSAVAETIWQCFAMPGNGVVEEISVRHQKGDL